MSTATQEIVTSVDALMGQVRQMCDADLDAVLDGTLVIAIRRSLANDVLERYSRLQAGLIGDKLTEAEHTELRQLADTVEASNAKWSRYMAELADLRETTPEALKALPEFSIYFSSLAPGLVSGKQGAPHNVE